MTKKPKKSSGQQPPQPQGSTSVPRPSVEQPKSQQDKKDTKEQQAKVLTQPVAQPSPQPLQQPQVSQAWGPKKAQQPTKTLQSEQPQQIQAPPMSQAQPQQEGPKPAMAWGPKKTAQDTQPAPQVSAPKVTPIPPQVGTPTTPGPEQAPSSKGGKKNKGKGATTEPPPAQQPQAPPLQQPQPIAQAPPMSQAQPQQEGPKPAMTWGPKKTAQDTQPAPQVSAPKVTPIPPQVGTSTTPGPEQVPSSKGGKKNKGKGATTEPPPAQQPQAPPLQQPQPIAQAGQLPGIKVPQPLQPQEGTKPAVWGSKPPQQPIAKEQSTRPPAQEGKVDQQHTPPAPPDAKPQSPTKQQKRDKGKKQQGQQSQEPAQESAAVSKVAPVPPNPEPKKPEPQPAIPEEPQQSKSQAAVPPEPSTTGKPVIASEQAPAASEEAFPNLKGAGLKRGPGLALGGAVSFPKAPQGVPPTQPQTQPGPQDRGGVRSTPLSHPSSDKFEYVPAKQSYKANTGMRPPVRPGYGREGRPIRLQANHFKLNISLNNIFHYDIALTPNKLPKRLNRIIFEDLVAKNRSGCFKNVAAVYDGSKSFYTVQRMPFQEISLSHDIMIEDRKMDYKAKLQFAAEVNLFQLQQFWEGRCAEMPMDAIQAIDVALKHNANLRDIPVGRSLYPMPETFRDLGEGCELWMGRFQSVRPTQWKMTLNIDMAATAFYQPLPVIEFMNKFFNARQPLASLNNFERIKFQKELKNLKVRVDHQGSIKRTYVVRGLTKLPATQIKFTMERDGVKDTMTVADYFQKQYNKRLRFPNLPCLHVGNPQKQIYLPLEVCSLKEGQKKNNQLSDMMVASMIKHTALPAPKRKENILNSVHKANFAADPLMRAFGISVDDRLLELDGRVIEPPSICYIDQARESKVFPSRGVWDMRKGQKFIQGAHVTNWALICFENPNRCPNNALRTFFDQLANEARDMGMSFNPVPAFTTYARDPAQAENIFSEIIRSVQAVQLVVVILPGRSHIYGEIKRLGDVVFGILTQCIQSKNLSRANHSLLVNICLKINVKCEGLNSIIHCPAKVALFKEPVIVFGADVTHPMPGDTKMPSIAAVVASMDSYPQKYTACVKAQGHRVEIIEDLSEMVIILLKRFFRFTNAKPRKIIFYRDGVSEGQFLQVLQYEVAAIQKACTMLQQDYQPSITFAVVQKRHHTRLFCANQRDEVGKSGNIPPGTIVDKGIVHPREFDFFLCSHAGIQGTSRPTHYHILWDDSNFTADEFQSFTYALCHTYVRCNRAVSIPAPAYYAHHVAFRARYHLGDLQSDTQTTSSLSETAPTMNLDSMNKAITIQNQAANRMYFA